ncbi:FecR family protein [Flavivirga amylovorans]|uniref:FecR family protein n=1 Tax=Flavivirga amylovorans TaxID=870486 RepID=A0ABT8WVV9_9FLAO|nr:FecR family protein [Flavivirga amylovorans]MDO5985817.1 FecR family protein [Flavivirga amylovorans]
MSSKDILFLIEKYFNDDISKEESKILESLLKDEENARIFKDVFQEYHILKNKDKHFKGEEFLEKIITPKAPPYKKVFRLSNIYKYAAMIVFIFGLSFAFYKLAPNFRSTAITHDIIDEDVQIKFEDGSKQILALKGLDSLKNKENITLGYLKNGELTYKRLKTEVLVYNTINVPYGKHFQMTLSDGTIVYLNAGTRLRYPVNFIEGLKREVYLEEGEAYFDVTKDEKHQFIVNTKAIDVAVYGTKFNVSAYQNDKFIETTLEEGSVKVYEKDNINNALLLVPNEQSIWNNSAQNMSKKEVYSNIYSSWIKGELQFENVLFEDITKRLERHFNVAIQNDNTDLKKESFTASFKEETLEDIMLYFSKSYGFKFNTNKKRITIR